MSKRDGSITSVPRSMASSPSVETKWTTLVASPVGGEAAHAAAGGEHTVAGDDDEERVGGQRLADGSGRTWRVEALGDLSISQRGAGRDAPDVLVDATMEGRNGGHVEPDALQVDGFARQEARDGVHRMGHVGRRRPLDGIGMAVSDAGDRRGGIGLRQERRTNAVSPPHKGAGAETGLEEGISWGHDRRSGPDLWFGASPMLDETGPGRLIAPR